MKIKRNFLLGRLNIRIKLLIVLTVCITVFSYIIMIISKSTAQQITKQNLDNYTYEMQSELSNEINLFFTHIKVAGTRLAYNIKKSDLIKAGEVTADINNKFESLVNSIRFNKDEIGGIVFISNNGNKFYYSFKRGSIELPDLNEMSTNFKEGSYIDPQGTPYVVLLINTASIVYEGVSYENDQNGYLLIYIKEEVLSSLLNKNEESDIYSYLISKDGTIISHPNKEMINEIFSNIYVYNANKNFILFPQKSNENQASTFISNLNIQGENNSLRLVSVVNYEHSYNLVNKIDGLVFLLVIFIFSGLFILTVIISRKIIAPLESVNVKMKGFDGTVKAQSRLSARSKDEIMAIEETYDEMVHRIHTLIEKNSTDMEKQRELELAALQVQINPHFLYNTLDTIAWIAKLKKQTDIEQLVISLAKFFRISLHKGDKYIKVYEEIELIKNYVQIEKIRYPEKIELTCNISESVKNCLMLKIILQPIVEDSIKHGFANLDRPGHIVINGFHFGTDIIFEVIDDGVGFDVPEDFLEKKATANEKGGYGLKNVDERIKLEYGEDYGIFISSQKGKGTKTVVRIKDNIKPAS